MKKQLLVAMMLVTAVHGFAGAGDSIAASHAAIVEHYSMSNEHARLMWNNPALMATAHHNSLTQMGVTISWAHQDEPFVMQHGTGHVLAEIGAQSYLRLNNRAAVWGRASYLTGKNRGIKWNSVADYDLLEPDVLADTVGGDTRRERYTFEGGYSTRLGHWQVGGEMLFRAEQQYRKQDPRMRGIVTDLTLRAGVARHLGLRYTVGLSMQGNIYRQTCDVDFYKPLGSVPEYQMMGLGEIYTRFSGDINDLIFKGGGIKLQADLLPAGSGLIANVWVSQHSYERVARLLNSLPLTTLYNKELAMRAGWRHVGEMNFAVWSDVKYNRRTSDQHLAGTSSSQIYPVIASMTMYKNNITTASLNAIVGREGTTTWNIKASAGYSGNRQRFVNPRRSMKLDYAFGQVAAQLIATPSRSWTLMGEIDGAYYGCTRRNLVIPVVDIEAHFVDMLTHNFNFLNANYTSAEARFRAYYHFGRSRYSAYAQAAYGITSCSRNEQRHSIIISLGIKI
jgi:hypothetical protein